eukprot:g8440.t1
MEAAADKIEHEVFKPENAPELPEDILHQILSRKRKEKERDLAEGEKLEIPLVQSRQKKRNIRTRNDSTTTKKTVVNVKVLNRKTKVQISG